MNKPFRTGFMFGLGLFLAKTALCSVSAYTLNTHGYRDRIKRDVQRIKDAVKQDSEL